MVSIHSGCPGMMTQMSDVFWKIVGSSGTALKSAPLSIRNAQLFLLVQQEFGDFDRYIWQFTCHRTLTAPRSVNLRAILASTSESDAMGHDLRRRGFQFVGTIVCYAFMQATGMVNDHIADCFRSA